MANHNAENMDAENQAENPLETPGARFAEARSFIHEKRRHPEKFATGAGSRKPRAHENGR